MEQGSGIEIGTKKWQFLAVSDVHLRDFSDDRGLLLLSLLATIKDYKLSHFSLLGDIFDFCLGSKQYFRNKFGPLGQSLGELSRAGTQVHFLEGNHEFDLASLGWEGVNFITTKQVSITLDDSRSVSLTHGDLVYASRSYLIFRRLVKSFPSRLIARLLPGKIIDGYALNHAKVSRAADDYRSLDEATMRRDLFDWLAESGSDFGFFGHFHCPIFGEILGERKQTLMSSRAWDKPNVMALDSDGVPYRWYLDEANKWKAFLAEER